MKKIIIMTLTLICSAGTFAQQKGFASPHAHVYTRIYVAPAYGPGFNYGYPFYGYPYFGFPYDFAPYPYISPASYKLNAQISAVKSGYRYQIKAVKKDKSISSDQKKQDILQLKAEREKAIAAVEKNYHKRGMNSINHAPGTNNSKTMLAFPAALSKNRQPDSSSSLFILIRAFASFDINRYSV